MQKRHSAGLWLCMLFICNTSLAQTDYPLVQADALMEDYYQSNQIPGMSVAVGHDNLIIWSQGYGYADLEQDVPVRPAFTKFRVGSVSKPMVSVALGLLMESGNIDLDEPVQRYIPDFPEKPEGVVTSRLLAAHLAGIRHYQDNEENFVIDHYDDVTEALTLFADDPLVNAPGAAYSYSSYGYVLLSAVIQSISGQNFLDFMEQAVFAPLDMQHTIADQIYEIIPNRARPYMLFGDVVINARPADNSYKWAGGGFLSTSEDLVRFGLAMLNSDVLREETKAQLWDPMETSTGEGTEYGMGWRNVTNDAGERIVFHTGGAVGGAAYFGINLETGVVVAITMNLAGDVFPGEQIENLFQLFDI